MDAVLRVDDEACLRCAVLVFAALVARARTTGHRIAVLIDPLVDASRAIARRGSREDAEFRLLLQFHVPHLQVDRLFLLMVGVGQEHRGQPVEGQHTIRLRIVYRLMLGCRLGRRVVRLAVLHRAEGRKADERVQPHVQTAKPDAQPGAEARPERLDVAHPLEIDADLAAAPLGLVAGQLVMAPALGKCLGRMFRSHHSGKNRVVRPLDPRDVDEAGGAADQRATGEGQLRHRLPAALGDRPRAVGDALAALEGLGNRRMCLETLEFFEGRKVGVLVVEVDDEADRDLVVLEMVEEGTTPRVRLQRPAERVLDQPRLVLFGRDLPQFLEADAEFLRLASIREVEFGDQLLGQ